MKNRGKPSKSVTENISSSYLLYVHAKPNSQYDQIEEWTTNDQGKPELEVRVSATPENGKANKAIINLLAKTLGTARTNIELVSGGTSRHKTFRIEQWSTSLAQKLPSQTPSQQ